MEDQDKQAVGDQQSDAQHWITKIAAYDRAFQKWMKRAEAIAKRYRDYDESEGSKKSSSDFNILWSNIQTLLPATFARVPKPDVSRRWRDNDSVGRVAALLLERALTFEVEHYPDYRAAMNGCVLDRFLGGRGTAWVRYEPHFSALPGMPEDGVQITEDADEVEPMGEQIDYECAPVDYVHWRDFGHSLARTWEEVTSVWRKVYLSKKAVAERFGEEIANLISYDTKPAITADTSQKVAGAEHQHLACVYEIWDKESGTAKWLSKSMGRILDERPDPLRLENFFPCPRPLFATMTTDNLVPVPDYKMYQDQAKQLDKLSAKIDGLIDMLVVKGVHDASVPELARLFKEATNGSLIPVKNFAAFAEKAGLKGTIDIFDISPIVAALNEAYAAQEKIENTIYQLVGVSDIVRGASDPTETYGAQKLKGQYGNMRLRQKQDEVVLFATQLLQIKSEIICSHFQPETFLRIAAADQLTPEDQQLIPQALQLLMGERAMNPEADTKEGPLAAFRIEVSSDSMVQMDEQQEKAERVEFLGAVSGYISQVATVVAENPQLAPLAVGLLKFGVTGFKIGKQVEGMIDEMLDQMVKQAAEPQPEKPDPDMVKVQGQMQLQQQKQQDAVQLEQMRAQLDAELAANEQRVQAEQNAHQIALEEQRAEREAQLEAMLEQQRIQFESAQQAQEMMFNRWKEELQAAVKIEVANIASKAKLQDAATETATNEVATEVKQ
jgi:hypothetical protein